MVGLYMEPLLRRFGNDPVNMYMAFDTEFYLPNDMLFKVDSMSMANSLEVRVPYLDRRIVELALNIPSAKKISFRQTKIILRKACQDKFPPSITMRRKKGFTVPVGKWFLEDLGDELSGLAENSNCRPDFINTGFIKKLIKEHRGGIANHGYKLWILYIFFLWNKSSAVTPKQNDR
jgi:asparagine synthase (glutamine-hydrolysing)